MNFVHRRSEKSPQLGPSSVHVRAMRNRTRLGLAALVSITGFFVACGDDSSNPTTQPVGGTASGGGGATGVSGGGVAGTATGGTVTAGTATAGSFATAGTGGDVAGTGGTMAGTAGTGGTTAGSGGTTAGTAGTGGTVPAIVPTVFLIDNIQLRLKGPSEGGAGGMGGVDAGGMGGAGAGGEAMVGGAGAGPVEPSHAFSYTFDIDFSPLAKNPNGFSPGQGAGPPIFDGTILSWDPTNGVQGGAAKMSVPFTVAMQQADFFAAFPTAGVDLTGYELVADVNMTETGDVGTCASAWMYVYGAVSTYANDLSGEPMSGQTQQLTKGTWTKIRLDLDGPYGYHSTHNHPNFKPTSIDQWGIQLNTWGCP